MKLIVCAALIYSSLALATPAQARNFNDLKFPDKLTLAGTETQLQLNGIGMRTKFVFDVYIGGLYTELAVKTRDEVQAQKGPKRMLMHFVYDEVDAEKITAGWTEGFEENLTDEKFKSLSKQLKKFNTLFVTVHAGDVIFLDYVPGTGTTVKINGDQKGVIEGEDFYPALLDVWLGEEPADEDMKEGLLGGDD